MTDHRPPPGTTANHTPRFPQGSTIASWRKPSLRWRVSGVQWNRGAPSYYLRSEGRLHLFAAEVVDREYELISGPDANEVRFPARKFKVGDVLDGAYGKRTVEAVTVNRYTMRHHDTGNWLDYAANFVESGFYALVERPPAPRPYVLPPYPFRFKVGDVIERPDWHGGAPIRRTVTGAFEPAWGRRAKYALDDITMLAANVHQNYTLVAPDREVALPLGWPARMAELSWTLPGGFKAGGFIPHWSVDRAGVLTQNTAPVTYSAKAYGAVVDELRLAHAALAAERAEAAKRTAELGNMRTELRGAWRKSLELRDEVTRWRQRAETAEATVTRQSRTIADLNVRLNGLRFVRLPVF